MIYCWSNSCWYEISKKESFFFFLNSFVVIFRALCINNLNFLFCCSTICQENKIQALLINHRVIIFIWNHRHWSDGVIMWLHISVKHCREVKNMNSLKAILSALQIWAKKNYSELKICPSYNINKTMFLAS